MQGIAELDKDNNVILKVSGLTETTGTHFGTHGDVLALCDSRGYLKFTMSHKSKTFALHGGAKLVEEWKKTTGGGVEKFPEYPGYDVVQSSRSGITFGERPFIRDGVAVGVIGQSTVYYSPDLTFPTRTPKWVKWEKGDQSITVYDDRRVVVRGMKTYNSVWTQDAPTNTSKLDVSNVTWDGKTLKYQTSTMLNETSIGLERFSFSNYLYIKE